MELLIKRRPAADDAILGDFLINGKIYAFSLERASKAIPAGRYRVLFTVSGRASRGELWSPDLLHRLPLVAGVPGRSGIRFHAANYAPDELSGCIALGQRISGSQLVYSRAAVQPFVELIAGCDSRKEEVWLSIRQPLPPGVKEPLNA